LNHIFIIKEVSNMFALTYFVFKFKMRFKRREIINKVNFIS